MTMDEAGRVQWTPTPAHLGGRGQNVVVAALNGEGNGTQQSFSIIVSERAHPLGTDEAGRDMLAALILGTRWTIWPGLVAAGISLLLGVGLGGLAGYYERRADAVLSYTATLSESLPALLLIFLAAVIFRYNLYPVMLVLGVVLFPAVARGIKARVLALKARQFIEASRELGLSHTQILWHDIIWHNTRPVMLTRLFYAFALAVAVEVTLSYLRLGIQPPQVSWGNMILAGRPLIENHQSWLAFWPALATILAVAGYYLLGSGLARRFRVRGT
jgi:peptide/nickel transport system permease protein